MRSISELSDDLKKVQQKAVHNLIEAQQETAWDIGFDVKKLAPKDTGRYADSIKVSKTLKKGNNITTEIYTDAKVISSKGVPYLLGMLLETGTSPHIIEPVNAKFLHFLIDGKDIYAKRVKHPGTVAQPHFQPSLEANKYNYQQKIEKAIRRSFE